MSKIIIAIDGYSSTGKSTVAKQLARALNYVYVDTGAMYRAITLFALEKGFLNRDGFDKAGLLAQLDAVQLNFHFNSKLGYSEMYLNGRNVEREIRSMRVSEYVSRIAKIPEVRSQMVQQQRNWGQERGLVMDGRDIGTVVFPDAELKLFMTASAHTRAERRYKELKEKGEEVDFETVLKNIEQRDKMDSGRKDSPLRKAEDAIEIDNSKLSLAEQFEKILHWAKERIAAS